MFACSVSDNSLIRSQKFPVCFALSSMVQGEKRPDRIAFSGGFGWHLASEVPKSL
jgi:hypothetical protein